MANYYPFGMRHQGYNNNPSSSNIALKKKYNGKELQDELGLNWYDYGARNYEATLGRWMNIDPLAEIYHTDTPYAYVLNNPLSFIDPDGRQIIGVTKDDAKRAHDDFNTIFAGRQFDKLRALFTRGKKNNKKTFDKIDGDALKEALSGLEGDDLALAEIVTNTINSDDEHKVEFANRNDNISSDGQKAMSGKLPSFMDETATINQFGGLPAYIFAQQGGTGVTTKTEKGSHSIIINGGQHNGNRAVTTGHELFGHGRPIGGLNRVSSQQYDAIKTENLILRVIGKPKLQIDGSKHESKVVVPNAKSLPDFR